MHPWTCFGPDCELTSQLLVFCRMDIAGCCLISALLIRWAGSGPKSPLTPSNFSLHTQHRKLVFSCALCKCHTGTALSFIISPTVCWWSFISLRFFALTNDGKGLWSSILSVTVWAWGSHTPFLPCCLTLKTYCQGVVDSGVHPAQKAFVCCGLV